MVATIRPTTVQESRPGTKDVLDKVRSWRPARCPTKLQGSGIPVLKLRQDSLATSSEQIVKRIEFNSLQSLGCPDRNLWIVVLPFTVLLVSGRRQLSIIPDDSFFALAGCWCVTHVCHHTHPHCRFRLMLRQRMSEDICLAISALRLR